MEVLLLIGLVALWAMQVKLQRRIGALEDELEAWRESGPAPARLDAEDPLFHQRPRRSAMVVRSARREAAPETLSAPPEPLPPVEIHAPEPPEAPEPEETLGGLFERFVGGRLLVWAGGIALAVAGIFLVRYSIEIGLITPGIRMVMAAVFGLVLLAAAEFARSRPSGLLDPRTGQALAGAGILVLYATVYGSLTLYGLVGNGTAFALMVAVTLLALFLSFRHGEPAAVMGIIGGFATPLLVGERSETVIPLLAYLALLNVALFTLAARRGWTWLAAAATTLSFLWTFALLFWSPADALAAGLFILLLSIGASLVRAGPGWHLDFLRPAAIGLVQLAILAARTDIGLPAWGLFALLALACFAIAPRKAEYRWLPALALLLALTVFGAKALNRPGPEIPWVGLGITILFAGAAIPGALKGPDRLQNLWIACAAFAVPAAILRLAMPGLHGGGSWGGILALLALGPIFLAWSRRAEGHELDGDPGLAAAAGTALLLLGAAAVELLPDPLTGTAWLLLALATAFAAQRLKDARLRILALLAAAAGTAWAVLVVPELWFTLLGSLGAEPALASRLPGFARIAQALLLPVPILFAIGWLMPSRRRLAPYAAAGVFAVCVAYVLFKLLFGLADSQDFVARGFLERLIITEALFAAGWIICAGKIRIPGLDDRQRWLAGTLLTALAAARLVWFDLLIHNPALYDQNVGSLPVLNLLAPAYLGGAFWLYRARRGAGESLRSGAWLVLALASLIAGTMLIVRQLFHGALLTAPDVFETESYVYSLAGLLLSIALLLAGMRLPDKAVRLAGLILLAATSVKVFVIDAAALQGVLRILSFMGLGVALIGIGLLYTKILSAERPAKKA
ncbi:MAG TPA: DUF2339 domain-containing protein [Allosphingosinicella sp.]